MRGVKEKRWSALEESKMKTQKGNGDGGRRSTCRTRLSFLKLEFTLERMNQYEGYKDEDLSFQDVNTSEKTGPKEKGQRF